MAIKQCTGNGPDANKMLPRNIRYNSLLEFYTSIANLFGGGHLGGVNIVAEKPLGW